MNWRGQMDWVFETRADDIVALKRDGHSLRAIGRRIGLSHVRILKILRERGEALPPLKDRLDDSAACTMLAERIAEIHPERTGQ